MFEPARPSYGGGGIGGIVRSALASPFAQSLDALRLLRREGVLGYLVFLLALVFACGVAVAVAARGLGGRGSGDVGIHAAAVAALCLAIAIVALFGANITSALTARKIKEARGLNNAMTHKRHLLVLGWKQRMDELLESLLAGGEVAAGDVVVVADIDAERAEGLIADPHLAGIRVVRGPHYAEKTLKLAAPERASAVLLLADESKPGSNDFEIDSRTVMAALVLARHVRGAHVVAELLDESHEPFLRNSRTVDEIVYPRRYGDRLLRMATDGIGLVNTVNALVSGGPESAIGTVRIPEELVGKSYADVCARMAAERPGALVIGIVEHTGKHEERKAEALREAQKTPDVARLVANLKAVKTLVANQPRLNPPPAYAIRPNTLAIVIDRKEG